MLQVPLDALAWHAALVWHAALTERGSHGGINQQQHTERD
jgi:hypothetical protein